MKGNHAAQGGMKEGGGGGTEEGEAADAAAADESLTMQSTQRVEPKREPCVVARR